MRDHATPLGALARGLVAGALGTAAITLAQRLKNGQVVPKPPHRWADAPAPAVVGKRLLEGVFERKVTLADVPQLTTGMHWGYGTALGAAYGLVQGTVRVHPVVHGLIFGTGVWALSYAELVPMGLQKPPWEYPGPTVAWDLGFHAVYGLGVAGAYRLTEEI